MNPEQDEYPGLVQASVDGECVANPQKIRVEKKGVFYLFSMWVSSQWAKESVDFVLEMFFLPVPD